MVYFDTHTHLGDPAFDAHRHEVVARAHAAGVTRFMIIGTTRDSSRKGIELAQGIPGAYAAVGIQPNHVGEEPQDAIRVIETLSASPRVVAIGETGIDHYWDDTPLPIQRTSFAAHIELAIRRNLPLIIHMREGKHGDGKESCARDVLASLNDVRTSSGGPRGVMHSFTGTLEMARAFLDLGFYLSFAGMVTYKNAAGLREVAAEVPLDRLLIETDSPYLTPHPHRGEYPNEPARVVHTAACLAELRGLSLDAFAAQTTANGLRLFGIQEN